ncbi:MAG: xylulokinase [Albidovulum sp.]|nr:xylulokinase [Albidovulum sp.]
MFLGIDLGTSGVKALLIDSEQRILSEATAPVESGFSEPPFSEQDPATWIAAVEAALDRIRAEAAMGLAAVEAIGLSGHMHGAVLLDGDDKVLRPCIMWNDGRSAKECQLLEQAEDFRGIGGNLVMAGFTAPKLLWVAEHEPEVFARVRKVLLPKDYIRLWLTGEYYSEMSDASGTLWLDVAGRRWSDALLAACNLDRSQMPELCEGTEISGTLRSEHCRRWGFKPSVIVAGGAGDNAAAACGMGIIRDSAFVSLGTSGVVFAPTEGFRPCTAKAIHAFCHAAPDTWHQMGVILSAASCIEWLAGLFQRPVDELLALAPEKIDAPSRMTFLPYLTGVRTPHNDPNAQATFFGLTSDTEISDVLQAVLEGVGFALQDCFLALSEADTPVSEAYAVGGGARSLRWLQTIANITGVRLLVPEKGEYGASFGAARLAMAAANGENAAGIFAKPVVKSVVEPDLGLLDAYNAAHSEFCRKYFANRE